MNREVEIATVTILMLLRQIERSEVGLPQMSLLHRETLKIFIRGYIDKVWFGKLSVSRACDAEASSDGLGDIRKMEPRQIPAHLRKKYHLEHYLPVADLRAQLLAIQSPSIEKVVEAVSTAPIMKIWLLTTEDVKLPRFNRGNPAQAYMAAGIEILS